ncbi:TetR/AcrR family transcriptional regulator [Pseudochelatococcus lubricantis]|uniref:TetR/AcrR family transcriptional regulator n=1 Tax=Pseudochelatococcus lubricantis TaxID=1538102 RepID=UPI0035E97ED3
MPNTKPKTSPGSRGLSRKVLAEAAIELMEAAGEAGFTLRKLGARVGCDPMSILYHFKSKEGLFRAMADQLEAQIRPAPEDQPWRGRLRHLADQYRSLALRFPHSFRLMQRFPHTGIADYGHVEMVHRALKEAGIADRDIPGICLGWYTCITGLAMGEVGGLIRPATDEDALEIDQLPDASYPLLKRLLPRYRDLAPNAVHALTIELLLDGIVVHAAASSDAGA